MRENFRKPETELDRDLDRHQVKNKSRAETAMRRSAVQSVTSASHFIFFE